MVRIIRLITVRTIMVDHQIISGQMNSDQSDASKTMH